MKWLKIIGVLILILAALAGGGAWYISTQYGTIIEKLVVKAVNNSLKNKVHVNSIEPSAFSDFPKFSLNFNQVTIYESEEFTQTPDTLIYLNHVSLQFNIWDIYNGNYRLKKVEVADGFGQFEVNKKGVWNYEFWKTDTTSSDTGSFAFELSEVAVSNVRYSYIDKTIKLGVRTEVEEGTLIGNFTEKDLKLIFNGSFNQTSVKAMGVHYLTKRNLLINSGLEINHETGNIHFLKGNIEFDKAFSLSPSGIITDNGYEFKAQADNIKFEQLNSLVPTEYEKYKEGYKSSGNVTISLAIKGEFKSKLGPKIDSKFSLSQGTLEQKKSGSKITGIELLGSYTNGKQRNAITSVLDFKNVKMQFAVGKAEGSAKLYNFKSMLLKSKLQGKLDLNNLKNFLEIKDLVKLSGEVELDVHSDLILSKLLAEKPAVRGSNIEGSMQLKQVTVVPNQVPLQLSNFNGLIKYSNKSLLIDGLTGKIQSSNVELSGSAQNFLFWLFSEEKGSKYPLNIVANLKADKIDVNDFVFDVQTKAEGNEKSDNSISLRYTQFELNAKVEEMKFDNFTARNLQSTWRLKNNHLLMNPLSFSTMQGNVDGKFMMASLGNGHYNYSLNTKLQGIDIEELFTSFNNFSQTEITAKNLNGIADAEVTANGLANPDLEVLPNKLEAWAKLKITDGQLVNYKTLKAISDYFKKNAILKTAFRAEELEKSLMNINFKTLENEIMVGNGKVIIPRMKIGNNIMAINAEGEQYFDGRLNYRFDFDVSELLVKKKKHASEKDELERQSNGGIRVFLKVTGTTENPIVEIDKESKKAYRKQKRDAEGKELKTALKTEFGWFSKDSTLKEEKPKEKDFEIEWEENDSVKTKPAVKNDSSKEKKGKLRKIFDVKEEEEFDFGDDDF